MFCCQQLLLFIFFFLSAATCSFALLQVVLSGFNGGLCDIQIIFTAYLLYLDKIKNKKNPEGDEKVKSVNPNEIKWYFLQNGVSVLYVFFCLEKMDS